MPRDDWRAIVREVLAAQEDETINSRPGPALQWYPKQILGDDVVLMMDLTAEGAHRRLMDFAWQQVPPCSVPDDLLTLRGWCKHPEGWEELIWPQVSRAWRLYEGRWWQIGLCRSYLKQVRLRIKRAESARAGWKGERGERRRRARQAVDDPEQMQLHGLGDAFARKIDALQSSSSGCSLQASTSVAAAARARQPAAAEDGDPENAEGREQTGGHALAAAIAAGVKSVEACFRQATGVNRALGYWERDRVLNWIAAGAPLELLEDQIRSLAARQVARGRPIGSFRYLLGALEEAVTRWREGQIEDGTPVDTETVEGYRAYIVVRCESGLLAQGGDLGDSVVRPMPAAQLRRAKHRALAARSLGELEAIAKGLTRAAEEWQRGDEIES